MMRRAQPGGKINPALPNALHHYDPWLTQMPDNPVGTECALSFENRRLESALIVGFNCTREVNKVGSVHMRVWTTTGKFC